MAAPADAGALLDVADRLFDAQALLEAVRARIAEALGPDGDSIMIDRALGVAIRMVEAEAELLFGAEARP